MISDIVAAKFKSKAFSFDGHYAWSGLCTMLNTNKDKTFLLCHTFNMSLFKCALNFSMIFIGF